MKLSLSSATAPGLGLEALLDACVRRGLAGLELVEGHAHGVGITDSEARLHAARRCAEDAGVSLVAFRLASAANVDVSGARRIAAVLEVPVFRPCRGLARAVASNASGAMCWQAEPALGDLTPLIGSTLRSAGDHLTCARLCGAGPESAQWSGRGIGSLMVALTMAGFAGSLIMAPSAPGMLPVWRTWLGRSRGTGCGSRHADSDLVQLSQFA